MFCTKVNINFYQLEQNIGRSIQLISGYYGATKLDVNPVKNLNSIEEA